MSLGDEISLQPLHGFIALMIVGISVLLSALPSFIDLTQESALSSFEYMVNEVPVDEIDIAPGLFNLFIERRISIKNGGMMDITMTFDYRVTPKNATKYIDIEVPNLPITVEKGGTGYLVYFVQYRNNTIPPQDIKIILSPRVIS